VSVADLRMVPIDIAITMRPLAIDRILRVAVMPSVMASVVELQRYREAVAPIRLRVFDLPITRIGLHVPGGRQSEIMWELHAVVADRDAAHHDALPITFTMAWPLPLVASTDPSIEAIRGHLARGLRTAIREMMLHEIDECIMEGETRPFDPHQMQVLESGPRLRQER
jgi:hypothetical protein